MRHIARAALSLGAICASACTSVGERGGSSGTGTPPAAVAAATPRPESVVAHTDSSRAATKPVAAPARTPTAQPGRAVSPTASTADGAVGRAAPPTIVKMRDPSTTPVVRALYVNRFAAQSARRMHWLIGIADSTEINGLVVDMKDEFGLNYKSANA